MASYIVRTIVLTQIITDSSKSATKYAIEHISNDLETCFDDTDIQILDVYADDCKLVPDLEEENEEEERYGD